MRKSTVLWINITCIALNFTGVLISLVAKNWLWFIFHAVILYLSQSVIAGLAADLDKIEELDDAINTK